MGDGCSGCVHSSMVHSFPAFSATFLTNSLRWRPCISGSGIWFGEIINLTFYNLISRLNTFSITWKTNYRGCNQMFC